MFVFVFFSLQNFLHRLPGLWPGTVWASARQQHVVPTAFRRLWWGCSRNAMFPGESGTLRLTVLPPRSLSSPDDPGFCLWAGQRAKQEKKKRNRTPRPRWVGLPWATWREVALGDRPPPRLGLALFVWPESRGPPGDQLGAWSGEEVDRRGPVLGPCHPHGHWPGRCLSGGAALGLVISSPGRGDVLKREPNLGG